MTSRRYDTVKRVIDVVVAGMGIVITAPISALVAVLVRRDLGSPVIFRQARPGKDGEVFELMKFRSMRAPGPGAASDAERLTAFGRRLRASSLDELPTLWNVLRGDMSLVGPRPLLVRYLDRYDKDQRRRHEVRPGVTGLAQVNGRNSLSWERKFEWDVEYVERRSLWLDLRIIARTFAVTFSRRGISADGDVTMPEFLGSGGGER